MICVTYELVHQLFYNFNNIMNFNNYMLPLQTIFSGFQLFYRGATFCTVKLSN